MSRLPSKSRKLVGAAAFQLPSFTPGSAAKNFQDRVRKDPGMRDVDLVGVQLDARDWLLVIRALELLPHAERIDLQGVLLDSQRAAHLIELVQKNRSIVEIRVDDAELERQMAPLLTQNQELRHSQQKEQTVAKKEGLLQDRKVCFQEEKINLQRVEQKARAAMMASHASWMSHTMDVHRKKNAVLLDRRNKLLEVSRFFSAAAYVVQIGCHARYAYYLHRYLVPFFQWRCEQEEIGRASIAFEEDAAREQAKRKYFNSYEWHIRKQKLRVAREQEERGIAGAECNAEYQTIAREEEVQRGILTELMESFAARTRDLEETIANRVAEDNKRRQQRLAELDMKRQFRAERAQKDREREDAVWSIEKDKIHRGEMLGRSQVLQQEGGLWALLRELVTIHYPAVSVEAQCNNALRGREKALLEPPIVQFKCNTEQVAYHFPSQNRPQAIARDVSIAISMDKGWRGRAASSCAAFCTALSQYRRVMSAVRTKEQPVLLKVREATEKAEIIPFVEYILHPRMEVDKFRRFSSSLTQNIDNLGVIKQVIRGGEVTVSTVADPPDLYTCTFSFDSRYISEVRSVPNSATAVLQTDGLVSIAQLIDLVSSCRMQASVVPGCPLPLLQKVTVQISLQFCSVRESLGKTIMVPSPKNVIVESATLTVLAKPLIATPKTPITWQPGYADAPLLGGITVHPPPEVVRSDGTFDAAQRTFDSVDVVVRLGAGMSPGDVLLVSSTANITINKTSKKILFEDFEIGSVVDPEEGATTLAELRATRGYEFNYSCFRLAFRFGGAYATAKRIEDFLRCVTFYHSCGSGQSPIEGKREVSAEMTYRQSLCDCRALISVVPHACPPQLQLGSRIVYFRSFSSGEIALNDYCRVQLRGSPMFDDACVQDDDRSFFVGGHIHCAVRTGSRLGDSLSLLASNGLRLEAYDEDTSVAVSSTTSPSQQNLDVSPLSHVSHNSSQGTFETATDPCVSRFRVFFQQVEVATLVYNKHTFIPDAKVVRPAFTPQETPLVPSPKARKKTKKDVAMEDHLVFAEHDQLTSNGPSSVQIQFATTGRASLAAANAILRSLCFVNTCFLPKLGDRTLELRVVLGPPYSSSMVRPDGRLFIPWDVHTDCMSETLVVRVGYPIIRLSPQKVVVKYLQQSGWKALPAFDFSSSESFPSSEFNGCTITAEITDGYCRGDVLWIRNDELLVSGNHGDIFCIPEAKPSEVTSRPNSPPSPALTAVVSSESAFGTVFRTARVYTKSLEREEIGTVLLEQEGRKLTFVFVAETSDTGRPTLRVTTQVAKSIANSMQFCSHTKGTDEDGRSKSIHVTINNRAGSQSNVILKLFVKTDDEPSEFVLSQPRLTYRHGLHYPPDVLSAFPVVPLSEGMVSDTDTEFFDGGRLSAEFCAGASKGDRLCVMTVQEQLLQYKHLNLPPKVLISVDASDHLMLESSSMIIGKVLCSASQEFAGAWNLFVDFAASDIPGRMKSIVPIALVSYILNCFAFVCGGDRARVGPRIIRLSISDGSNPSVGKATVQIDVISPIIYTPNNNTVETTFALGGPPAMVAAKVQIAFPKEALWTVGYIECAVLDPSPLEWLAFTAVSFAAVSFEIRESTLYDNNGNTMGKIDVARHRILLSLVANGKFGVRQLDTFLRCLTYESKDSEAAAQRAVRRIAVRTCDGTHGVGYNEVIVQTKLSSRAK